MEHAESIPLFLQRSAAFIVFAESAVLVALHSLIVARSAVRAGVDRAAQSRAPAVAAGFLAAWVALAIVVADGTRFPLPRENWRLPISGLVAMVPILAAVALLFGSKTWRAINAATQPEWLIGLQFYRVAGGFFLYPFMYYGWLPPAFAWPAAVGDMLTGALAPLVAWGVAHNRPHALKWAVAWNLFGILDLIVAPTAAFLSQAPVVNLYPLALVPLFLGPPLGILTHVYSLRNIAAVRRARGVKKEAAGTSAFIGA